MIRKQILIVAFMTASVFCMLAVMPLFAQTNEPSLGEVARKNRAAKAKRPASKETKVEVAPRAMTEATVNNYGSSASLGSNSTQSGSSSSQASEQTTSGTQSGADSQSSSETTAKTEPSAAKSETQTKEDRVTRLKKDQESLKEVIERLRAKAADADENRRQTLNEVIRNAEAELEKKERELSEAERSAPKK